MNTQETQKFITLFTKHISSSYGLSDALEMLENNSSDKAFFEYALICIAEHEQISHQIVVDICNLILDRVNYEVTSVILMLLCRNKALSIQSLQYINNHIYNITSTHIKDTGIQGKNTASVYTIVATNILNHSECDGELSKEIIIQSSILDTHYPEYYTDVKCAFASSRHVGDHKVFKHSTIITDLARDPDPHVRGALANNKHTPPRILLNLTRDNNDAISSMAYYTLAGHLSSPEED